MGAQIRVSVKRDRYANAHGFFSRVSIFPYHKSMNRCRQLYFYHFLMILSPIAALHICRSVLYISLDLLLYCDTMFQSFFIPLCIYIFCSLYHPPKSDFRWPLWLVLSVAQANGLLWKRMPFENEGCCAIEHHTIVFCCIMSERLLFSTVNNSTTMNALHNSTSGKIKIVVFPISTTKNPLECIMEYNIIKALQFASLKIYRRRWKQCKHFSNIIISGWVRIEMWGFRKDQ